MVLFGRLFSSSGATNMPTQRSPNVAKKELHDRVDGESSAAIAWKIAERSAMVFGEAAVTGLALRNERCPSPQQGVEMKIKPVAAALIGPHCGGRSLRHCKKRREAAAIGASQPIDIHGFVSPGYEAVRDAFADNFLRRREIGAACCVYHKGEKVVDLWGGVKNKATCEPWEENTMALVYSATKGLAAMTLAVAHSRGWLDYDELVSTYWPEFAQNGKENITVRQLLAHQAALFALDVPLDRSLVGDFDRLADVLARQKPAWQPGTRQAYHAVTIGFL
jgi:hypothetical protein